MRSRLIKLLQNFGSATESNVASIFAFALIPIIAIVGTAADYSPANAVRAAMPSAFELAGLPLQRNVQVLSADQLQSYPNFKNQLVIIRPPNGVNTQDPWHISQSQIDVGQKMTWDKLKPAGITLYPMRIDIGADPTSMLPKNGTSNTPKASDHYFLLKSATEIVMAFNHSTTNLAQLYLEK